MLAVHHPSPVDGFRIETKFTRDRKLRPRTAAASVSVVPIDKDEADDGDYLALDDVTSSAGDRRRPTSALIGCQLLRHNWDHMLLQQVSQPPPFEVDEDNLPKLRYLDNYPVQWTGVFDIDGYIAAHQQKPATDKSEVGICAT
jgi:hypothetical protein